MCDGLYYLFGNIFIRFGSKLYRQITRIPMPVIADLFSFCYVKVFMLPLSDNNQTGVLEAFYSTLRFLDDLLKILIILILNNWKFRYIPLKFS